MEVTVKLKLLTFEKCSHCDEVYFFYLVAADPEEIPFTLYASLPASCRQEAFSLLDAIRANSHIPMTDAEYNRYGMEIVRSKLPECMPNAEILIAQQTTHANSPQLIDEITKTIKFLHHCEHGQAPRTIN